MTSLYAVLDVGTSGNVIHQVVSINISDPNNITYVPFGIIPGFADKYVVSATFDPTLNKIFFALSDGDLNTAVDNMYLYSVSYPDLSVITPFCTPNTVYINLNPQVTYNVSNNLFYYAINHLGSGYDYTVNTIDSSGNITVTNINVSNIQISPSGVPIFNNYIYAPFRINNSFSVYYASITDNTTGSISGPIFPEPPGQIWSVFDLNGVLWGTTELDGSSPPSYALYQLKPTQNGLPLTDPPLPISLVGNMPMTFEGNSILNITLFIITACIHGSAKILLADNNTQKQISTMTISDVVLCPNNKCATIKEIIPCWNHVPNKMSNQTSNQSFNRQFQYMAVFEKDSISQNTPNERFAIDLGHPMCTIDEYLKDGDDALRPAIKFINNRGIYCDTIDNIHKGALETNIRYDLILENSNVYIANNLVIKARKSFSETYL
jgi:hypothetical protein